MLAFQKKLPEMANIVKLFLLALFVTGGKAAEQTVVINEIDLSTPSERGAKEFIELRGFEQLSYIDPWIPMKNKTLQGYWIIGIVVEDRAKIELVVNLWNSRTDARTGYAVAGAAGV